MKHISINDPKSLEMALRALQEGGVIVYPTDTAYGLGADATNSDAIAKLFAIKDRDFNNPVPVMCGTKEQAEKYVIFSSVAHKLADAYWPGALTMALDAQDEHLAHIVHSTTNIGVRVPAHDWCRTLAEKLGRPITSTSANASSTPAEYSIEGVVKSLGNAAALVDLFVDGGTLPGGPVSTVVVVDGEEIAIKREGAISREEIEKVLE